MPQWDAPYRIPFWVQRTVLRCTRLRGVADAEGVLSRGSLPTSAAQRRNASRCSTSASRRLHRLRARRQSCSMSRHAHSRATGAPSIHDYAAFVRRYFGHYAPVACAPQHLEAAARVAADPHYHGLWKWFRGAAKSTHASLMLPLWLACRGELRFGLIVGKTLRDASRLLGDLRTEVEENAELRADFAIEVERATTELVVFACGGERVTVRALGMGQSPRGLRAGAQRPDYIVADDLDHRALSQNPDRVRRMTDWVLEDLLGTFDIGRGRFVLVNNLFSRTSILYTLEQTGRFDLLEMNAFDAEGMPTWPAKYGDGEWLRERERMLGYTAFMREYQNTPIDTGTVIRPEWVRYGAARELSEYAALVCYIDPSYSHSTRADYKAAKLWGLLHTAAGPEYHHLAAFVRQAPMGELVQWCYDKYAQWGRPANLTFIIEGTMQPVELQAPFTAEGVRRGGFVPITTDPRKKPNKLARLESIAGLWQQGRVVYAEALQHDADTQVGLAQWYALGQGSKAHDDGPDADEGALYLLARRDTQRPLPVIGWRGGMRGYG